MTNDEQVFRDSYVVGAKPRALGDIFQATKDGETHWYEVTHGPLWHEGNQEYMFMGRRVPAK
jgi:hypothetical protein